MYKFFIPIFLFFGTSTIVSGQIDTTFNWFEYPHEDTEMLSVSPFTHIIEDTLNTKIYFNGERISYQCFTSSFVDMAKKFPSNINLDSVAYSAFMNVYCSGDDFITLDCVD
jgi:hypothetical protein